MKKHENSFIIAILISLLAIIGIVYSCLLRLAEIKQVMQAQFDYKIERDMCQQDAMEYLASCHVERDEDGSYHWYFNPNEGRM